MWSWLPANLERWIWALGIGTARTLPIVTFIPAFGGQNVPSQVRMALAVGLSLLCLPYIEPMVPTTAGLGFWVLLLAREVAVGVTVGFVGSSIFRAAEVAGRLIDTLRGSNMAEVISPVTEGRASPLGDILLLMTTVIFFELDGVGFVAMAIARSYRAVPLVNTTTPATFRAVANLAIYSSTELMVSSIALAAPAIVALLLADLVLGAIARMAQQVPVYFVGMPLKGLAGIGILLVGLGGVETAIVGGFKSWMSLIERAFAVWR